MAWKWDKSFDQVLDSVKTQPLEVFDGKFSQVFVVGKFLCFFPDQKPKEEWGKNRIESRMSTNILSHKEM